MGTKKKKAQKNAAFKNVKLKIGKTLKKTNTTDTTIESRRVVLLTQLEEQNESTSAHSFRGLSLDNLCSQLGHYSKSVRKNAIVGAKQILSSAPHLIETQLRTIVPAFTRLISIVDSDSATNAQLRSLLELVCSVPSKAMAPHFTLFVAHVLRGLTHSHETVRSLAVTVLHLLLERYPSLCRESNDIFQTLVHFISSNRTTSHSSHKMVEFVADFLKIYDEENVEKRQMVDVCLQTEGETGRVNMGIDLTPECNELDPFYFPVLSTSCGGSSSSLFSSPDALLSLTSALSPLLARIILDSDRNHTESAIKLLGLVQRALERQPNKFLLADFDDRYRKAAEPIRKAVSAKKDNKKVFHAAAFLL